jgi:hypothetical protein
MARVLFAGFSALRESLGSSLLGRLREDEAIVPFLDIQDEFLVTADKVARAIWSITAHQTRLHTQLPEEIFTIGNATLTQGLNYGRRGRFGPDILASPLNIYCSENTTSQIAEATSVGCGLENVLPDCSGIAKCLTETPSFNNKPLSITKSHQVAYHRRTTSIPRRRSYFS